MDPEYELKKIQKRTNNLMKRIDIPNWVKSSKGESFITNGKTHVNSYYILTMDIANFYDSIPKERVYELFDKTFKMEWDIAAIITSLVMNEGHLPTGGPANQIITFWAYRTMFLEIESIAKKYDCQFTLYVDDMTFSSKFPITNKFKFEIISLLEKHALTIKKEKIHYYTPKQFKIVTGVGISNRGQLTLPNSKRKKILEQFELCRKTECIKEIEKLKGLLTSAREIENNIFPSIHGFIGLHATALKEYARQRQKEHFNRRKRQKN
jgi:hypothetical protein